MSLRRPDQVEDNSILLTNLIVGINWGLRAESLR